MPAVYGKDYIPLTFTSIEPSDRERMAVALVCAERAAGREELVSLLRTLGLVDDDGPGAWWKSRI